MSIQYVLGLDLRDNEQAIKDKMTNDKDHCISIILNNLREHGGTGKGHDFVNHDLEIISIKGLNLLHSVFRAVVKGIRKNAGGSYTSCTLHAVTYGTCV